MSTHIDWGRLKAQGRVKDIGIPWSTEEMDAIYKLAIPAEFVREGCLTREAYNKAFETEKNLTTKPLKRLTVEELQTVAKKRNIVFTPDTPKEVLIGEIEKAETGNSYRDKEEREKKDHLEKKPVEPPAEPKEDEPKEEKKEDESKLPGDKTEPEPKEEEHLKGKRGRPKGT